MAFVHVLTGLLVALITILLALYTYFVWNFNYWKRRGVSGPKPKPYLGTYPKSSTFQADTNFLLEADEIFKYVIEWI